MGLPDQINKTDEGQSSEEPIVSSTIVKKVQPSKKRSKLKSEISPEEYKS